MKLSKDFIKAYDAMFAYVLKTYGLDDLIKFWQAIAPVVLADLQIIASKKGVVGCYEYWDKVLTEEGCKFRMTMSKDNKKLSLEITNCSSINTLNQPSCPEYCRHCGIMYPVVLEAAGLHYEWKKKGAGRCEIAVSEVTD